MTKSAKRGAKTASPVDAARESKSIGERGAAGLSDSSINAKRKHEAALYRQSLQDQVFELKDERESAATAASKLKANRISAAEAESSNMKKQQVAPFSLGARHWRTPKALPSVRINCDWKQQRLAL